MIAVLVRSFAIFLIASVAVDGVDDEEAATSRTVSVPLVFGWRWEFGTCRITEGVAALADSAGLPAVLGSAAAATTTPTNNPAAETAVINDLRNNRATESSFLTDSPSEC